MAGVREGDSRGGGLTLADRARRLIPMGVNTSSKAACRFAEGFGPTHVVSGHGAEVMTSDGRTLIDWAMGLGPVLLGHGDQDVRAAVAEAANYGVSHTLPTRYEVEVAEVLNRWVPGADMVRFLKTGSDACAAAVRLARAFTRRDKIVRCGYHGWHDWAMNSDYEEKLGIPQAVRDLTVSVPFNDHEAVQEAIEGGGVAAVILEPVSLVPPDSHYLWRLRHLCNTHEVVLIFDEVITGIRMGRGGAAGYFGVTPDLTCLGKGLANGFPLAAVTGRVGIMRCFEDTHISGTYNGETSALAACLATLRKLDSHDFWSHQRKVGLSLRHGYERAVDEYKLSTHTKILGMPHFTSVQWPDPVLFTLFQQEMIREGILFSGSQFPSLAHTDEQVRKTRDAYYAACQRVAEAIETNTVQQRLECRVNRSIFTRHR